MRINRLSLFSLLFGFGLWQLLSVQGFIDALYFPSPFKITARAVGLFLHDETFRFNMAQSLKRLLCAQCLALPSALILALTTTLSKRIESLLSPWLGIVYPIPKLALFPFFLILLGTGDLSKIVMIALSSFFLMYLSFHLGFKRIFESENFEIVRIYKIPKMKLLTQIFIKGALPEILNGIKIGFGYGLVIMVGSEMTMSRNGLGFQMWNSWDQFRILDMYACLAWISLLGFGSFGICEFYERRARRKIADSSSFNQF